MSGSSGESIIDKIDNYLASLTGVDSYVIASEGLPVKWSAKLNQDRAEEIIALATDLIQASSRFTEVVDPNDSVVSVLSSKGVISALKIGNLEVVAEGVPGIVETALKNIRTEVKNPVKCPHCSRPLSLAVFRCPHCGSRIPLGTRRCPHCGRPIKILRCPYCGGSITPSGGKIKYVRPRTELIIGTVLIALGIASTALMYIISPPETKPLSTTLLVGLGGMGAYLLSLKEPVEE